MKRISSSLLTVVLLSFLPAIGWWIALTYLTPDQIQFSLLGRHVVLDRLHHKGVSLNYIEPLVIAGLFLAEAIALGWRDSSARQVLSRPRKSTFSDILGFIMNRSGIFSILRLIFSFGVFGVGFLSGDWIREQITHATGFPYHLGMLPLWAEFPILYLVYTCLDYWTHRIGHTKYFWPLHRYHHAAEDFCIFTAVRTHPADVVDKFVIAVPIGLLGASPEALALLASFATYVRFIIHSRVRDEFGWLGRTLFQAPVYHRLHHVLDMSKPTGNFAILPLWDHLFGTWRPSEGADIRIGVTEPYRHGAWVVPDLARDYRDFIVIMIATVRGAFKAQKLAAERGPGGAPIES